MPGRQPKEEADGVTPAGFFVCHQATLRAQSVLICTAAGREGINLEFARVLFNRDLPWNPMDLEQRIGRIHRYGQVHTAQVSVNELLRDLRERNPRGVNSLAVAINKNLVG